MRSRYFAGFIIVLAFVGLGHLPGCKSEEASTNKADAAKTTSEAQASDSDVEDLREFLEKDSTASGSEGLPPGHPPISGSMPPVAGVAPTLPDDHPPIGAAAPSRDVDLHFEVADSWRAEQATSPMRLAQYRIPRSGDDTQDGELIVFQFGPNDGGPVNNNIDRWEAMFTTPQGLPATDSATEVRNIGGLRVTTLDVAGHYNDPMRARSGGTPIAGEARLLAAIVETPKGRYFFKAIGPRATINVNETAFENLVASLRLKP